MQQSAGLEFSVNHRAEGVLLNIDDYQMTAHSTIVHSTLTLLLTILPDTRIVLMVS